MALYRVEDTDFNLDSLDPKVPVEFGYESEHPAVSLPFSVAIRGKRFDGNGLVHCASRSGWGRKFFPTAKQ